MGYIDESKQTSEDLESENATTNNVKEETAIAHDESDSNKKLISFTSSSSSTSSDFSLEDVQNLDSEHDKSSLVLETDDQLAPKHDENDDDNLRDSGRPPIQSMEHPEPSHVFARTGPGNWSMASNESLFSIHMGGTSFCHLDSFSPMFELPENNQESSIHDESTYDGNHIPATNSISSSSSNSFVFPILSGETENGGSPNPRGSLPQSPPKLEPAPERRSNPTASEAKAEAKETTTFIAWTKWFPCFRYCACCS